LAYVRFVVSFKVLSHTFCNWWVWNMPYTK